MTRDKVRLANKSQAVGKGGYSDHQTIPGSPNTSFLATLGCFQQVKNLISCHEELSYFCRRTAALAPLSWKRRCNHLFLLGGYLWGASQTSNLNAGGRGVLPVSLSSSFATLFALPLDPWSCCDFSTGRLCFKPDSCSAFYFECCWCNLSLYKHVMVTFATWSHLMVMTHLILFHFSSK